MPIAISLLLLDTPYFLCIDRGCLRKTETITMFISSISYITRKKSTQVHVASIILAVATQPEIVLLTGAAMLRVLNVSVRDHLQRRETARLKQI